MVSSDYQLEGIGKEKLDFGNIKMFDTFFSSTNINKS